eukprot:scaffold55559_cov17-Tisochrysis_lutea.AAC.1
MQVQHASGDLSGVVSSMKGRCKGACEYNHLNGAVSSTKSRCIGACKNKHLNGAVSSTKSRCIDACMYNHLYGAVRSCCMHAALVARLGHVQIFNQLTQLLANALSRQKFISSCGFMQLPRKRTGAGRLQ